MQCERFESNTFDLVWGCESGEHMPDKKRRTLSSSFFHILCGSPETCAAQVCRRDVTCPEAQRLGSFVDPTGAFREPVCSSVTGNLVVATWCERDPVRNLPA